VTIVTDVKVQAIAPDKTVEATRVFREEVKRSRGLKPAFAGLVDNGGCKRNPHSVEKE
jgi:hypothetical protein